MYKPPEETGVIVVGGSLVGLSAAVFLSFYRVPFVVLERHSGSSLHPRAIGFTARTMELFRQCGFDDKFPEVSKSFTLRRVRVESLAGKWFEEINWTERDSPKEAPTTAPPKIEYSPRQGAGIAQDTMEEILRQQATACGADLRYKHKVTRVAQDTDGVTVTVAKDDGAEYLLRGSYMLAADGSRSSIREGLGIKRSGRGSIQVARSVLFRASLDEYLQKGVSQFNIDQSDLKAFLTTYSDGRWVLIFIDDIERNEDELKAAIHQAVGRMDIDIELITTGRWEMTALVANQFQADRIFLAGDAAHALPPNRGGYGANTGIADVHNLAWKLKAVLSGQSKPELLETYDDERRPVALLRHDQIFVRSDYKAHLVSPSGETDVIDDDAMEFGQLYRSQSILGAGKDLPKARRPDEWAGQPGSRAPHFWVRQQGKTISTLDLFEDKWSLLFQNEEWKHAALQLNASFPITIRQVQMGIDVGLSESDTFTKAFGISSSGASLVRPDGYIAWRSVDLPSTPGDVLRDALAHAAFLV
ncbi:hypothetical protein ASPZODRAFT_1113825 [Penicilliopsis zonata CBS 506.65]|uniref:FAD-binding domain-containing protein n=1 Tax=Penicilliopsis zonata CBS 506.65 TaxID=1073090 RepID=A0A1L9SSH6_9EURO|nr:hypothetical protein ASPZODRAFT_1113825 [Penicilliopsis zonata CBS 506.65]OJJ50129.1 hypothetical protein ASPZODRAFT_1113825 [Penicilliopsis zonata CBS 506.65]